ncbi:MAG: hypothetical protein WC184_11190 [Acidimicrobiia bacterium]
MVAIQNAQIGPWFRRHPSMAIWATTALFCAVFALQWATADVNDAVTVLFVFPIALVALAFGVQAGVGSAFIGVALMAIWVWLSDVHMPALGWAARILPMLLLGFLIGHASDMQRRAEILETDLAVSRERQRDAAEINDTLVQSLVVAKWKLEAGDVDAGIEMIETTIHDAEALVASLLGGLRLSSHDRMQTKPQEVVRHGD